ncbi:MAG: hypothetical protein JRI23_08295 [Deltaproteobacteria bacterium]|jgi:hypothetical protein|nr:hypothetical protein [Deltaproteobacteria bacterium]MBW2531613.1 hypothetical protein [Deltaproteobacteria bacterium]
MQWSKVAVVAPFALAGGISCAGAPGASPQQLQTRAVFDLGCAQHQLVVYHVDERTKAVAGCGRRLVYVESCQRIRGAHACTWILDTPTFQQARWPDWQGHGGPPGHAVGRPAGHGQPPRPVATQLFGPVSPPLPTGPPPPANPPEAAADDPSAPATGVAPARGSARRPHHTDLFDPTVEGSSPPEGREIPTNLFDPHEL